MERSGENIWSEIQAKCRAHLESGEPIRTLVRETPNWIVAVEPTFIRRRSEDASTAAGESKISKAMILGIWDSLVRTGESQYTGPYRFAWALVGQLIEGIGFEREPFRLVFRDREQAMKPFHDEASSSSAATPNHIEGQNIVAVYVPDSAQTNLRVGLEHQTWGFKETRPDYEVLRPGDLVVLATGFTGGSPRVQSEEWMRHQLREVIVGRLTSAVYESHDKVWPDEGGDTWYPHRFMFDVALREQDVELAGQKLGPSLAEALRRSAIQRGGGYVCPVEGSLLGRVGALDGQAGPAAAKSNDTAPEGSQPAESIAVEPPSDTSVWWVNQGKTYRLERDRGLVWAPQKNKQGRSWFYWTNVSRLRAGHVTLHYAKGAIRALGLVTGNGRAAPKPADMPAEEWEADGWTADVTYFELDSPIALEEVTLRSSETGSPFGSDGAVKQGYLFAVSEAFAQQLREAHAGRWPAGSPWGPAQPLRYWLFQANPATWDIDGYLAAAAIGDEDTWTASRYHNEMTPGDKVLLWKSGPAGGVVGRAEIVGPPELAPTPDWRDSNRADEWRVPIRRVSTFLRQISSGITVS